LVSAISRKTPTRDKTTAMHSSKIKEKPCLEDSKINIPGTQSAGITAWLDRRRHLPSSGLASDVI
jgi:hypothetical protein